MWCGKWSNRVSEWVCVCARAEKEEKGNVSKTVFAYYAADMLKEVKSGGELGCLIYTDEDTHTHTHPFTHKQAVKGYKCILKKTKAKAVAFSILRR